MKNIKNIFYAGILVLCVVGIAACSDDDTYYDFPGDPYNHIFMQNSSGGSYMFVHTPVSSLSTLDFKLPLHCNHRAASDISVTVEVDNSLIAAYNEENGTEYAAVSVSSLTIENTSVRIQQGAFVSIDSLHIVANDAIGDLRNENGYLIPIKISSIEGNDCKIVEDRSITYVIVTVKEDTDNINDDATVSNITGALVADQTGWSATTTGTVSSSSYYYPIETLFDGDIATYCYISSSTADINLDIDMGKSYTFDGIKLSYGYSSTYEYSSLASGMTIYSSNDGVTWNLIGTMTKSATFCAFYAPVTTRYVRIVKPKGTYSTTLYGGVFNVYAK